MQLSPPYAVYLGNADDILGLKMAASIAYWRPEQCVGEITGPNCQVSIGLPNVTVSEAAARGAKTFVLGFNNAGGHIDSEHFDIIKAAIANGMDIVNGLHDKLADQAELVECAARHQVKLLDIRHPTTRYRTGTGAKRSGKRLLTVGTDCSVGKMYTTLAIERELLARKRPATFRATGQCGILIAGQGVAVDCVVADFISGAIEHLTPDNDAEHWDVIEGQGSLFQPAFAGVTIGLIHGAQPDALVVCHALGRTHVRGLPDYSLPSLADTIAVNLLHARRTNPACNVVGISLNTSGVDADTALAECQKIAIETGLPCVDPVRHGVAAIVDKLN
jgi:uncharacterized NAD-dependent epimerase/dehydratase family protein